MFRNIIGHKMALLCLINKKTWLSSLTRTRGTLKATGSMVVLLSLTALATSTSRISQAVFVKKHKACPHKTTVLISTT